MTRVAAHPIDPQFLDRHSPRAMSGQPLSTEEVESLLEAAHWAPSSGNNQPWRFVVARQGTPEFKALFDLLVPANQVWCQRAGALLCVVSKGTRDDGKPARTASFDTGAAWMSIALQAMKMGLVAHGMEGFDYDRARGELHVPEDHKVEAMVALGHPGKVEDLPEKLRPREEPSQRRPVKELYFNGRFPG